MSHMEKIRVLAADDEYWSRENLRNLLPWQEYGMEFLEPACDGEEVLERMEQEHPDILLTDINMPFMDGLELLSRMQTEYPEVVTVAVSGYDDFEKVKGTFLSGGIDYLLKPVGREDLEQVIRKIMDILEKRKKQKEQEDRTASVLSDGAFSALLNNQLYGREYTVEGFDCRMSGNTVALIKYYDIADITEKSDHDIFQAAWDIKQKLLQECLEKEEIQVFHYTQKMSEFIMVGNSDHQRVQEFAHRVEEAFPVEQYGPVSVVLYQNDRQSEEKIWENLGKIYRELISVLVLRPFRRVHSIQFCTETDAVNQRMTPKSMHSRMDEEMLRYLREGQNGSIQKLIFETMGLEKCVEAGWTYLEVKQLIGRINNVFYAYVRKERPQLQNLMEESMETADYYLKCLNARELMVTLNIMLESMSEKEDQRQSDSVPDLMDQIHRHIEENYPENITLTELAEKYHLDASHLSRTFSRTYGESVIAFLTRIRMEKAAELMKEADRKLEAIAFLVGYDDYHYFSRVFRKKMGISPSEYRNKNVQH